MGEDRRSTFFKAYAFRGIFDHGDGHSTEVGLSAINATSRGLEVWRGATLERPILYHAVGDAKRAQIVVGSVRPAAARVYCFEVGRADALPFCCEVDPLGVRGLSAVGTQRQGSVNADSVMLEGVVFRHYRLLAIDQIVGAKSSRLYWADGYRDEFKDEAEALIQASFPLTQSVS